MHIHSCASDGSHTPDEIITIAIEKGINIISVTDHESMEYSRDIALLAKSKGLKTLNGIELSSTYNGKGYDILGYGIDLNNEEFQKFTRANRKRLDDVSVKLLSLMSKDYECISLDDYKTYDYNRKNGGWKCLHYLASLGLEIDYRKCTKYYSKYKLWSPNTWFPDTEVVISTIKSAGGYAILAHPGVSFTRNDIEDFNKNIKDFLDKGIDGVECLYPIHDTNYTMACKNWCKKNNMMITAGSDSHGLFLGNSLKGYPLEDIDITSILQML